MLKTSVCWHFLFFPQYFLINHRLIPTLGVALQTLGRKFYKNTKLSSLYSQSLLIFVHKTPVVESHPITREIRDLLCPRSAPTENTVYLYPHNEMERVYWNRHGCPSVRPFVRLAVDTIFSGAFLLQFCIYCSEIYT